MSRQSRPQRETIALARSREKAARALIGGSLHTPEEQVWLLKGLCRYLWSLLDRRSGQNGVPLIDDVWCELEPDAKAAVDRTFEAVLVLWSRDRIFAEPCKRILDDQLNGRLFYQLIFPNGDKEVVNEETIMMMAGV